MGRFRRTNGVVLPFFFHFACQPGSGALEPPTGQGPARDETARHPEPQGAPVGRRGQPPQAHRTEPSRSPFEVQKPFFLFCLLDHFNGFFNLTLTGAVVGAQGQHVHQPVQPDLEVGGGGHQHLPRQRIAGALNPKPSASNER